jgi:cyclohexadienyl dehydratase
MDAKPHCSPSLAFLLMALVGFSASAAEPPKEGHSATIDHIRADGVIKVGVIVSPPFIMQDPIADTYTGPIPVFMEKAAKGLGAKVEWVAVNWDTMMAGLQAKQYEVLGTAVYATEPRKKVADFVNFSRSGICYVSLKSAGKVGGRDKMRSDTVSIVIPSGASFTQELPKAYPKIEVATKPFPPGANDFFDDVRAGRYDLTIIEGVLAPQVAALNPDLQVVPAVDECLASPDFPVEIGIAVNKGDSAFEAYLSEVVKEAAPEIDAAVKNNSK